MALTAATSPSSLPQSSWGLLEVNSVPARSQRRMMISSTSSAAVGGSLRIPKSSMMSTATVLGKDDVRGEQRRRAQDRGKALAGKSTLNRLELTAPDYDGSPRQKGSDKPETKKIVADPESIDALLVDLFLEAHPQVPERIVLDLDATDDLLYGHQEGRFYHGYYRDYCYLPLCRQHL